MKNSITIKFSLIIVLTLIFYLSSNASNCPDSLKVTTISSTELITSIRTEPSCFSSKKFKFLILRNINKYLYLDENAEVDTILNLVSNLESNDSSVLSGIAIYRSNYYIRLDNENKALEFTIKSRDLLPKSESTYKKKYISNSIYIASLNLSLSNFDIAFKSLDSLLKLKDLDVGSKFTVNNQLGIVFKKQARYKKAIEYFLKATEVEGIDNNDKTIALSNLSGMYININKYDKAIKICKEILANKVSNQFTNTLAYSKIVKAYLKLKDSNQAKFYLDKMNVFVNSTNNQKYIDIYNRNVGDYLIEKNRYGESSKIFKKSYNYNLAHNKINNAHYCFKYRLYSDISKYNKELGNDFIDFVDLSDSLSELRVKNTVHQWETKYETEKKEAENKTLLQQNQLKEAKIKTQRMMMAFGGIGLLLLSGLLFVIYRQKKKQKKLNEVLADRNIKISLISREIAHRAKNQLALATNLISYQKNKAEDIGAKQLIEESENKLKALSAVNKRLSDDDELARVNLKDVVEEVVANNIYSLAISNIDYDISLPNTAIDSNKMSLIALIINELTTNSIKHAFQDNPNPKITVEGTIKDDKFTMKYKDNGNIKTNIKSEGLGQSLITGLVNQLQGIYKIDVSLGFVFDLNIPI